MNVLITGASSGIGYELAKTYALHNHELILTGRNKKALQKLQKELSTKTKIVVADLATKKGIDIIKKECSNIDCLINNAGLGDYDRFDKADENKIQSMIDVNITALTQLTREVIPHLLKKKNQTHIINIASVAGFMPGPQMAAYFATKNYVLSLSEALAEELAHTTIAVTTICPGPVNTQFTKTANIKDDKSFKNGATPAQIAQFTYESMKKKKRVAVYGFSNKLLVQLVRFLPRKVVTQLVNKVQ